MLDKALIYYHIFNRYEAGLLFAYLAFIPFCEAGVMDIISLQVSGDSLL